MDELPGTNEAPQSAVPPVEPTGHLDIDPFMNEPVSPIVKKEKKKKVREEGEETASGTSESSSSGFMGDFEDFFEGKYFKQLNIEDELDKYIYESRLVCKQTILEIIH